MCFVHNIVFTYFFWNLSSYACKYIYFHLKNRRIIYAIENFMMEKFIIFQFIWKGNTEKLVMIMEKKKKCNDGKFSAKGQTNLKLDAISLNLNPINLCTSNSITENCFRLFVCVKEKLSFLDYSLKSILSITVEKVINKYMQCRAILLCWQFWLK